MEVLMKMFSRRSVVSALLAACALTALNPFATQAFGAEKAAPQKVKVAWSIYTTWLSVPYAEKQGIAKRIGEKYGIQFEFVEMSYAASLTAYQAGEVQAVVATNIDVLGLGRDSTAIYPFDYSNGNDAVLVYNDPNGKLPKISSLAELKGQTIHLVVPSLSQNVLYRALSTAGLTMADVKVQSAAEETISSSFGTGDAMRVCVTWNPIVMEKKQMRGVTSLFTSAQIPGEVQDLMVVDTKALQGNPQIGDALTEMQYDVYRIWQQRGPTGDAALTWAAKRGSNDQMGLAEFKSQLVTTATFWTPKEGISFFSGPEIKGYNKQALTSTAALGNLGEGVKVGDVGIQYPDGSIEGNPKKPVLRYTTAHMAKFSTPESATPGTNSGK